MICFYCNQVFTYNNRQGKCKIDSRFIPDNILVSKKTRNDCPLESQEMPDDRADEEKYYPELKGGKK